MKNMKRFVVTLLVLSMVLALTGTALAGSKVKAEKCARFVRNAACYKYTGSLTKVGKKTSTVVRKGSYGYVLKTKGSWALVQLTYAYANESLGNYTYYNEEGEYTTYCWVAWIKCDDLKTVDKEKILCVFSDGGVGLSKQLLLDYPVIVNDTGEKVNKKNVTTIIESLLNQKFRISPDSKKHVKAKAKVWLHKTPSLSNNYGVALHKGDKLKYRRKWGFDTRGVIFYGVKYKGKNLWVSEKYTELVK